MPAKSIKKMVLDNERRRKALLAALIASESTSIEGRLANRPRQQMVWAERLDSLTDQQFRQRYRINKDGFHEILEKIRPSLAPPRPNGVRAELKLSDDDRRRASSLSI